MKTVHQKVTSLICKIQLRCKNKSLKDKQENLCLEKFKGSSCFSCTRKGGYLATFGPTIFLKLQFNYSSKLHTNHFNN